MILLQKCLRCNTISDIVMTKEKIGAIDGRAAYSVALKNLHSILTYPQFMMEAYPDKFFKCRNDDRWGLLLPGKLVYFGTASKEEIKEIKGGKMTVKDGMASVSYVFTRTKGIKMKIPDKAIADVIAFTEEVKTKMSQLSKTEVKK
jgi:hypothetical protein